MLADNYRSSFDTAGMRWGFPPCHRHRLCPNTVGAHASCLLLHISAEMQRPTSLGERAKQTQAAPSTPSSPKHGSLEVLGKLCMAATKRHPERHDAAAHTHTTALHFCILYTGAPRQRQLSTVCVASTTAVDCVPAHLCSPATEYPQTDGRPTPVIVSWGLRAARAFLFQPSWRRLTCLPSASLTL
jgi:hypothetical protein